LEVLFTTFFEEMRFNTLVLAILMLVVGIVIGLALRYRR